jgi:hypothetical protein
MLDKPVRWVKYGAAESEEAAAFFSHEEHSRFHAVYFSIRIWQLIRASIQRRVFQWIKAIRGPF